ncbi:MAG TPA: XRE family transcriptional regulator [Clostridiales bacterium]|nr:XRE family transcriptional regulator [Clostridiales bacterium]
MIAIEPPPIGKNITILRKQKNMSLDELSKRSGVSKSMLSQIEQEKANPTVVTVWKIARSLDVSISELMESNNNSPIEVIRRDDAPVIYSDDRSVKFRINSPVHMTDNLEVYHTTFKALGKNKSNPHFPNAEEFFTVISGKFRVTSGDYSVILCEGDTARYKGDREHTIENITESEAEAYLVVHFPKS